MWTFHDTVHKIQTQTLVFTISELITDNPHKFTNVRTGGKAFKPRETLTFLRRQTSFLFNLRAVSQEDLFRRPQLRG